MERHDVVIVGGGIGGTAAGALLAAKGKKVLLLDKNSIIGGRCASYVKDDFVVDIGVHLFGLGEKGPLHEVLRRVGMEDALEWNVSRKPRPQLFYNGENKVYSRQTMMENVPKKEQGALFTIFGKVVQMQQADIDKLWYISLTEWLNRFTTDKMAHLFMAMICGQYFCVPPDEASAAEFIICFKEVLEARSSAYPMGGCIAIPKAYRKAIEKNRGEVRLSAPVKKIVIEDGKATGVIMESGDEIAADIVISNADIKYTTNNLVGAEHYPEDYVKRVNELTYAAHALALKVALDKVVTDQKLIMYIPVKYEDMGAIQAQVAKGEVPDVTGGMITSPSNYDPSLAPEGKQLIFFGTPCLPNQDWDKWGELCMKGLKEVLPEIEGHILWSRVDSPDDVDKYAGEEGNIIGVGQTIHQIHDKRPSQKTPIKNLYLASAEAGGHGIGTELAANSAMELVDMLEKQ